MNCYVCHLPTSVSIPEAQDSACLVPCCQKCLQSYSVEGAMTASASKIEQRELVANIIEKLTALQSTYETTQYDEFTETLELLYKLENEL